MKTDRKYSIGVFDSGFGGIQILKHIIKELPKYDYVYLADTKRVPYGNRKQEEIYDFSREALKFLFEKKCKLVIFACNTAASEALRKIQRKYLKNHPGKKVLGILIPAAEEAVKKTKNGRIGIIATNLTVKSGAFEREILKINSGIKIFQRACPLLVPIIENGKWDSKRTEIILERYLKSLIKNKIDILILGCTHYGILEKKIRKIVGSKVKIISEERIIGEKLKNYLNRHQEIEKMLSKKSAQSIYSTGLIDKFQMLGSKFFGKKIDVKKINLAKL